MAEVMQQLMMMMMQRVWLVFVVVVAMQQRLTRVAMCLELLDENKANGE